MTHNTVTTAKAAVSKLAGAMCPPTSQLPLMLLLLIIALMVHLTVAWPMGNQLNGFYEPGGMGPPRHGHLLRQQFFREPMPWEDGYFDPSYHSWPGSKSRQQQAADKQSLKLKQTEPDGQ